jgi:hypothetical protein
LNTFKSGIGYRSAELNTFKFERRHSMTVTVATYLIYLLVSMALAAWVAYTLSRNGKIFLVEVFHGDEPLADAVNRLLVVGFYLINLGFVLLYLGAGQQVNDIQDAFQVLSTKLGTVLLVLGVLHLTNVWILNRVRRRHRNDERADAPKKPPTVRTTATSASPEDGQRTTPASWRAARR